MYKVAVGRAVKKIADSWGDVRCSICGDLAQANYLRNYYCRKHLSIEVRVNG